MANERIGRIESIEGQATVAHADGSNEVLHSSSQIFFDDTVSTGKGTHLSIRLLNGSVIEIGSEQSQKLDSELIGAAGIHAEPLNDGTVIDAISGIGILAHADGDVQVTRDGESVTLRVGDPVYTGDIIKTGPAGSATLTMSDGSTMSLGAGSVADFNDPVLTRGYSDYLEPGLDEATEIQAAIQAGRDPSEDAPAPGAGEVRGSEGGEAVILQASSRAITPESGHETHGQELPFRIPEHELQLLQDPPVDAALTFSLEADRVTVSEESGESVTYTLSYTGGALTGSNQASVDLGIVADGDTVPGASDGVDYEQSLLAALDAGLAGTGVTRVGNTLTFAAGSDTSVQFSLSAVDDELVEGVEDIVLGLSGASITSGSAVIAAGSDAVNVDITEQDVESFPAGLAYTVAGSKVVTGEQLYGIDLDTGETTRIGEVLVNGTSLNPNAVGGMSLNPVDGFLYAVANSGNDSYLIRINPATAETEIIDSNNSFAKATAATHDTDGTLYLSFGHQIYIYDTANPGTTSSLTLIAQGARSLAVDAIAINNTGDVMYLANGDELWNVDILPGGGIENPVFIGQVVETIGSSSTTYTLDGMSFDDNGDLWGLDNAGNILRIDTVDASAQNVATISNSEVRGGGTDSLAISNVYPGTYVVLNDADMTNSSGMTVQDRADSYTHYIPGDEISTSTMLDETDLDIGSVTAAKVSITTGQNNETSVTNLSPSDVDNVYIKSDTNKSIAVDGFNSVDVSTRGEQSTDITITGAERGVIDTGEGEDLLTIITDPLVGNGGSDETFVINTDGGNDIVTLSPGSLDNSDFVINAGEHTDGSDTILDFDILRIDDDIDLGALNLDISNIEGIDVTGSGNNLVQLSAQDVLDMTDGNNILRVDGDMTDAVQALDSGWVQGTDQMLGSVNYHTFVSGGVSLLVNEDMQLLGGINIP